MNKFLLYSLPVAFAIWAVLAWMNVLGQRKLVYMEGSEELYDFWMPRMCAERGYVESVDNYVGLYNTNRRKPIEIDGGGVIWSDWYFDGEKTTFITGWRDKVYPVVAVLPMKLFPATRFGGYLWSCLAATIFVVMLCVITRSWWPMVLVLSMPFIFNIERGNPVWLSAPSVGVFLAWWNDEKAWKRNVAAIFLAIAGALKIAPLSLGVLYFFRWRWKPVLICGFTTLALIVVPYFFWNEGFAAFAAMFRNAAEHSQYVLRTCDFGLIQLWRTVRLVLGLDVHSPWPGMFTVARIGQLFGFGFLVMGAARRDRLLLVGGMLLAAGNMYYYAMLYLFPVLVLDQVSGKECRKSLWFETALWFAILCPVQIIYRGYSCSQTIGNIAFMSLLAIRLVTNIARIPTVVASPISEAAAKAHQKSW